MADDTPDDVPKYEVRTVVYLDDASEPLLSYRPPVRFELDTTKLEDGQHHLRIEAYDSTGQKGVRIIPFIVRNGPGIAVNGLSDNDILEGKIPILINSYGGAGETHWEPSRAETPAPIPTWAWVLFIVIVAFGAFYGVQLWTPPPKFATTPTYGPLEMKPIKSPVNVPSAEDAAVSEASSASTSGASADTSPSTVDPALGASVYSSHCASCHQATGEGLPSIFPSLVGNAAVTDMDPSTHINTVLHGAHGKAIDGVQYPAAMPAFADQLSDEQITAVINHERSSWGNKAPTITSQDVAKLREKN